MKIKTIMTIIVVMMGITLQPVTSYAVNPSAVKAWNDEDKEILDNISAMFYSGQFINTKTIDIPCPQHQIKSAAGDAPLYIRYKTDLCGQETTDKFRCLEKDNSIMAFAYNDPNYMMQQIEKQRAAEEWINNHTAGLPADMETVKTLFSEIVGSCKYGNIHDSSYDVITKQRGACHAFARLFDEELSSIGIESYYIYGYLKNDYTQECHAWNAFVLDGKTYTVDITMAISTKGKIDQFTFFREDDSLTMHDLNYSVNWIPVEVW